MWSALILSACITMSPSTFALKPPSISNPTPRTLCSVPFCFDPVAFDFHADVSNRRALVPRHIGVHQRAARFRRHGDLGRVRCHVEGPTSSNVTGSPARVGLRMPRGANLECDIVLQSAAPAVLNGIPGLGPIHLREVGRVRFDVPAVRDMLQRLVEGALESSGAEIEYKRERGETRFLMLNARRLPGPDGKRLPWWRLRSHRKQAGG